MHYLHSHPIGKDESHGSTLMQGILGNVVLAGKMHGSVMEVGVDDT